MDNNKRFGKKEAIISTLKLYNVCFEDFNKFKYAGCKHTSGGIKAFRMIFGHDNFPKDYNICLCNTNIIKNYYVTNNKHDQIFILGKCCIKKFINTGTSLLCEICNEPHKNRKNNRCNICRLKSICQTCIKPISRQYRYCYNCHCKRSSKENMK